MEIILSIFAILILIGLISAPFDFEDREIERHKEKYHRLLSLNKELKSHNLYPLQIIEENISNIWQHEINFKRYLYLVEFIEDQSLIDFLNAEKLLVDRNNIDADMDYNNKAEIRDDSNVIFLLTKFPESQESREIVNYFIKNPDFIYINRRTTGKIRSMISDEQKEYDDRNKLLMLEKQLEKIEEEQKNLLARIRDK